MAFRPARLGRRWPALFLAVLLLQGAHGGGIPSRPVAAPVEAPLLPNFAGPGRLKGVSGAQVAPTLDDLWTGRAVFVVDVVDTGLPMGESDTVVMSDGSLRSYVHAGTASAGVRDVYGDRVAFPGCVVAYTSTDGGRSFRLDQPTCLFPCEQVPCTSTRDHIDQQQYPRVAYDGRRYLLVYEYRGRVRLRRSPDGVSWSAPERVADTGIWERWSRACPPEMRIGPHPYARSPYTCLNGGPPGLFVEHGRVFVFVALGQNPGYMGCYVGAATTPARDYLPCRHNPLFGGAASYGPEEVTGPAANAFFDHRTISSAEVVRQGARVYMLYEGVRGAGPGDAGDTQFGLGLARSATAAVDGPWEVWDRNPLLVDLPGNVGVGHADMVVLGGVTYLYTSPDGVVRSRLVLVWRSRSLSRRSGPACSRAHGAAGERHRHGGSREEGRTRLVRRDRVTQLCPSGAPTSPRRSR